MLASFPALRDAVPERSALRRAITDHTRAPEAERIRALAAEAALAPEQAARAREIARKLVLALRGKKSESIVQDLVREYDLSSREGVALMCLAEALLRIPDTATRDALIRDKLGAGDWARHLGSSAPGGLAERRPSLFVNAATWGLVVSGKVLAPEERRGLAGTLTRLLERAGEPVIRRGVDVAMRVMGEQFVRGQTIEEALRNSRKLNARGFRYSYDMLGEAAMTDADARRYHRDYEQAIHAIGQEAAKGASDGTGVYRGPGISVKLSAIHPRYSRLQRERALTELLPRLADLAALAARYDIGFSIDAEEVDRLELSLDLLEALAFDERLKGWEGLGFVVQAYQKRAPFVLDFVIDLARRAKRRMMVRLVKGAYWDTEIKRAQVDGAADFPVYTVKAHTDVSYIACARKLLDAPDAVFPQFATHNAQTLATIYTLAGPDYSDTRYEFQCLHGMGEGLYSEVVGPGKLGRPVRVYAPVGTHETLLAYLVRRLLENGANSSFVNRIRDPAVSVEELVADPISVPPEATHPGVIAPPDLFGAERKNSAGLDLWDENELRALAAALPETAPGEGAVEIRNPADRGDLVGRITFATPEEADAAAETASRGFAAWSALSPKERAAILARAADHLEERRASFFPLLVREAGKSFPDAVGEVREAVDFLRYYAAQIRDGFDGATHIPLGPVLCISPWNFPLAIFLGQVSAALAAGNTVLAKPAEETPLVAALAVSLLHEAGVPKDALVLVPGAGDVGARLVANPQVRGVLFTGSTEVARAIRDTLGKRLNPDGSPVPLIAETGGLNAMIVDSSALPEQVAADVLASAFDSAGQRCSALRLLCVQEEGADRLLAMLEGAAAELRTGDPGDLATDVGPVITAQAREGIEAHVEAMRAKGFRVSRPAAAPASNGDFVPPTLIEIPDVRALTREVFGPVLHVVRYRRKELSAVIEAINAGGYALTFGLHTRIDGTVSEVGSRIEAGNVYINRNIIGAVVGVQPFGGHGLSGTGPKAGGPLYLRRLLAAKPPLGKVPEGALPGPSGESNEYTLTPRGRVLCAGPTREDVERQIAAARARGNTALVPPGLFATLLPLPADRLDAILPANGTHLPDLVLTAADAAGTLALLAETALLPGKLVAVVTPQQDGRYPEEMLVLERSVSVNTMAAGGNVALMSL